MNMTEKISIVVPIYNVERYLTHCLESLVSQTYCNIEILLVDDGSPDCCGSICDDYAMRDDRIRVFHVPNGGVAKARQLGVERSTGEYIMFVDPDDWLPQDSAEVLYSHITSGVDIVVGGHIRYFTANKQMPSQCLNQTYTQEQYLKAILTNKLNHGPWSKLYRKRIIGHDSFYDVKRSQDFLMNIDIASRVDNVKTISDLTYFYRLTSEASTLRNFTFTFDYCSNFCNIVYDILNKNQIYESLQKEYALASMYILYRSTHPRNRFPSNSALVLQINNCLRTEKLSVRERLILASLNSRAMQCIIYFVVKPVKSLLRKAHIKTTI